VLTVDGNERDTIQRGEFLLLEVVLTNPVANSASMWNAAAEAQLKALDEKLKQKKISQEEFDKEKTSIQSQLKKTGAVTIGSEKDPWAGMVRWNIARAGERTTLNWPIQFLLNPGTDDIAELRESGYYIASYGIDPAGMAQLPAGNYELTAMIGSVRSMPIMIRIDAGSLTTTQQNSSLHLLRLGDYYNQAGDVAKAIENADKVLARDAASVAGLVLKADALRYQRAWAAALEMYKKALEAYGKKMGMNAEPPDYILEMMELVRGKM
jgi:tetratricopeptide (TPR) repeat protein